MFTRNKLILMILIIIILGCLDRAAYAQTEVNNEQKENGGRMANSNQDIGVTEISEFFTVDNNTYKVLNQGEDNNEVIFWRCEKLDDLKRIIVNNEVKYNGRNFKVKYIYEKAFSISNINEKNIILGDKILGFCDSSGGLVSSLKYTFKDLKELESIDFVGNNFIFGENCFQNCKSITNVEIPKNMNIMEGYCFDKCSSLKNIDLRGITEFKGQSIFASCGKLENIGAFNDEVTELKDKVFQSCTKLSIDRLNNITKLGNECFEYCTALNKDIVTDVEEIGDKCFFGCSFSEVYLKKAKKVGLNAFGKCGALKKIRFGNSTIPILENKISEESSINEWVYPISYRTQPDYLSFLSKLRASKVIWYSNYGNGDKEVTQGVKLNELNPPKITREGYEMEGWYKEQECINKVNIIADLGEINDLDLVIKDPKLYAKWTAKENPVKEPNPNNTGEDGSGEVTNPSNPGDGDDSDEETNPSNPGDTDGSGEVTNPSNPGDADGSGEVINPSNPDDGDDSDEETNPSNPDDGDDSDEETNPSNPEDGDGSGEITNPSNPGDADGSGGVINPSNPDDGDDSDEETNPSNPDDGDDSDEETNPSNPEDGDGSGEVTNPSNPGDGDGSGEVTNPSNPDDSDKSEDKNNHSSSKSHKSKKIDNSKIKKINWSFKDKLIINIEINSNSSINLIVNNNEWPEIYLNCKDKWYYLKKINDEIARETL